MVICREQRIKKGGASLDTFTNMISNEPGTPAYSGFKSRSTYQIVSITAYLLGVGKGIFENENEPPQMEVYRQLDQDKNARIVRNLCRLRTAIERRYKTILDKMRYEYKSLMTIEEIPQDAIQQLSEDGVSLVKARYTLIDYVVQINKLLSDRVNNCRALFPIWVNWDYIRAVFIMPGGLTEDGIKSEAAVYCGNLGAYPYQVYLNWPPSEQGNILYNDRKFLQLLYEWNEDEFTDLSKVSDAAVTTKNHIYGFLEQSQRAVMVVDCENSDPYKLCAVLKAMPMESTQKIAKILLYSDPHAATAWEILHSYTDVPTEYRLIDRIKENKSLVDAKLIAGTCKEHYENQADSFVLVSSDSDYWGLISTLEKANFLVMVESDKCGPDIKRALMQHNIFYCYIDDFYSGNSSYDIKVTALVRAARKYLAERVRLNVNDMLRSIYYSTRADMTEAEQKQFYNKFIKPMHLKIEDNGDVTILLRD